ncbi:MAG: hypothetical protein L6Q53_11620 [Candidatus Brocadia sinica]|nr:hypothetical protein [Candidatus Brocadia sinica]
MHRSLETSQGRKQSSSTAKTSSRDQASSSKDYMKESRQARSKKTYLGQEYRSGKTSRHYSSIYQRHNTTGKRSTSNPGSKPVRPQGNPGTKEL